MTTSLFSDIDAAPVHEQCTAAVGDRRPFITVLLNRPGTATRFDRMMSTEMQRELKVIRHRPSMMRTSSTFRAPCGARGGGGLKALLLFPSFLRTRTPIMSIFRRRPWS